MQRIAYRQIIESDIPEVIEFLAPTGSNWRSIGKIPTSEVDPDSVLTRLQSGHSAWVAWANGGLIGFSMANRTNGEVWAMAIGPEWEGKDIDRELMRQAEAWLLSHGWAEIWAAVPPEENAHGFCNGPAWQDWNVRATDTSKRPASNPYYGLKNMPSPVPGPVTSASSGCSVVPPTEFIGFACCWMEKLIGATCRLFQF
jgi:GNAT superfamily N-acetyltransferase